jgi:signal transduction histidine kinase/DNA-binding response OmpR family regulator
MNKKRVLIIDDDVLIRRALADYLDECGYAISTAKDGVQGLAQAQTKEYDVVLVDLRMPQMDGLKVISILKEQQPQLPLVVVSGTGVLSDAIMALRQGAADYITKPIQDMDQVVVVIERVLKMARLTAERDLYQRELEELNRSLKAQVASQTQDLRSRNRELAARNRELAALNRVSYAISAPLDLDTMLNRAIDAAIAAFEADGGIVRLLNPATNRLVIAASHGLDESFLTSVQTIPLGQGIVGQVAQDGHPHGGSNLADDPWLATLLPPPLVPPKGGEAPPPVAADTTSPSLGEPALSLSKGIEGGFRAYLCVPLRTGAEILGTLDILTRTARDFDAREVKLLATIGNQVGVAVARTQDALELERTNIHLERANAELRRLDILREQFIQNVTHELRTPLTLAHGYIEMLAQGDLNHKERQMALNVASRRVQALVDLVESITTLQDLDSRPLRIEAISPFELLRTATQMCWQLAMSAGIEINNTCPQNLPSIPGDFTRLAQALHQLLDNACKFSAEKSTVTITAQVIQADLAISIADQGIGIPPEEHTFIFDRFYQVDGSATRRYGGTGTGLALAKEIVEAHNGQITLKSIEGEGSVFTVWLPL